MKIQDLVGLGILSPQLEYDLKFLIEDLKSLKKYVDEGENYCVALQMDYIWKRYEMETDTQQMAV